MSVEFAANNPLCLPASPPQGGREKVGLASLHLLTLRWSRGCAQLFSPLVGEMPGRAEGGSHTHPTQIMRAKPQKDGTP